MNLRVCSISIGMAALFASAQAQQPPPATSPSSPGTSAAALAEPRASGAISGLVLDRVTGAPLAGASVFVARRGPGQGPAVQRRSMTDPRGRFVLTDLPPADSYVVSASKPGFFEAYYGPPDAPSANAQPIPLPNGGWAQNIEIRLTRQGVITGRVTDEAGEPVVGAIVRTLTEVSIAGRPQPASSDSARTDDRGEYRIPGLRAGRYVVFVPAVQHSIPMDLPITPNAPARPAPAALVVDAETRLSLADYVTPPPREAAPRAYPAHFFPDARTIEGATRITVAPGQTHTADLRLRPVPVWRVSGAVQTTEGSASGLILRLVGPGLEDLGIGSEVATAVVDDRGRFSFINVPAGRYLLEGRRSVMEYRSTAGVVTTSPFPTSPAFMMASGGGGDIASAPPGTVYTYNTAQRGGDLVGRTMIDVASRDLTDVVLPMNRAARVSGRIEYEVEADGTPGVEPAPLAGPFRGIVQAQPANGSASLGLVSGQIGGDSRFEIAGLLPGPYVLRVLGGAVRSITAAGKDITYAPIDGSAGQDLTDVLVTITRKTTMISGSVKRSTTGGTSVIVFPVDRERWSNYGFNPAGLLSVSAAVNGTFRSAIPGGDYYVVAVDNRYQSGWQNPATLAKLAPLATRVSVAWGESKSVDLTFVEVP